MERVMSTSRRGYSVRGILTIVLAVFLTALLWTIFDSSAAKADDHEANWKGESILYSGDQYYAGGESEGTESHGLPQGTYFYVHVEKISERPLVRKAHVIYFTSSTDPPSATSAEYVNYDYSPSNEYSNPQEQKTITMVPQGEENPYSSCAVEGGLGWVICPITVTLAGAMDTIFDLLSGFVAVQPATLDTSTSDLYVAWNVMRSFANVAFIIVFLVIIYSQLTSVGISNYGLKKLIPRLIAAALLVNLSYIICAAAIDISNILGYSLQDIFIQIRQNTFNIDNATYTADLISWESITGFVLSGGSIGLAAGVGIGGALVATGGNPVGLVFLILPALLSLILAILVVLVILAARQAIIVLLVVVAPLAFIAYLLPNTEKWFEKWRDLFMTMLIFFPAFSLVFGGSQLAGGLIIQNANSINIIILGMIVQVAPLVITPLLLKLSGGLLGRIAGIVNDPRKGLIDRTRNWANSHVEDRKFRTIGNPNMSKWNVAGRAARNLEYRKRRLEKSTERGKSGFELYSTQKDYRSNKGQRIATDTSLNKLATEEMQHDYDQAIQELRAGDSSGLSRLRAQDDKTVVERVRSRVTGRSVEELRTTQNRRFGRYASSAAQRASELDQHSRIIAQATASAQGIQQQKFAEAIEASVDLQVKAGGVDPKGAQRALAAAFAAQSKAHNEAVTNAANILSHYNYSDSVITNIALGDGRGLAINITDDIREAAISHTAGGSNTDEIIRLMEQLEINQSEENQDFRQTFADKLIANSNKPKFAGAGILGEMKQGNVPGTGKERLDNYIASTVNDNKLSSAELLVTQDKSYLWRVLRTMQNNDSDVEINQVAMMNVLKSIKQAKTDSDYKGRIGERAGAIDAMQAELMNKLGITNLDDLQD